MNLWMIWKILMKLHYMKKNTFIDLKMKDITDSDYNYAKISICMLKVTRYCWLNFLKTLQKCAYKFMN